MNNKYENMFCAGAAFINRSFSFFCYREFYYIQMEKYARQAISEGAKSADDLHVSGDCEIYRVLNLHYNRNNHIEVSRWLFLLICIASRIDINLNIM